MIDKDKDKREPGICVVHDDTHGWGGPEEDPINGIDVLADMTKKDLLRLHHNHEFLNMCLKKTS